MRTKNEDLESRICAVLDDVSMRILDGKPVDFEAVLAENPDIADQLRELEATVTKLASWGSQSGVPDPISQGQQVLGDFQILREIGRGGMGVVYEARQLSLNRNVALKILPFASLLDERQLQRFQNEARAAAILHHDNIVSVYSVGCERGVHYYAMELVQGHDLAKVIRDMHSHPDEQVESQAESEATAETKPIAALSTAHTDKRASLFQSVGKLGGEIARALDYAHEEGVVHRDIKPANLMLDRNGRVHITDFGLARIRSSQPDLTTTHDVVGTLRYASPEQLTGSHEVDHRGDIYSLGITLFELVVGQPAFGEVDREPLIRAVLHDSPNYPLLRLANVPRDLQTIIEKATRKEPFERYSSAAQLADDLERFAANRPIKARPITTLERATKFAQRNPAISVLFTVTIALLLVTGFASAGLAWKFATDAMQEAADAKLEAAEADRRRQGLYAKDMRLAQKAWAEGDFVDAESKLLKWVPGDGEFDLRAWEWYHLWQRCHDSSIEHTFSHKLRAGYLAFSPDGSKLFDGFYSGQPPIWNLAENPPKLWRKLDDRWAKPSAVRSVGNQLLIGSWRGNVEIRSWTSGERTHRFIVSPACPVRSIDLSPKNKLVAAASVTKSGECELTVWNIGSTESQFKFDIGRGKPSIAFLDDGQLLATTNESNRLFRISPETRNVIGEHALALPCSALAITDDRRQVAVALNGSKGSGTSLLKVLEIDGERLSTALDAPLGTETVRSIAFNKSGDEIGIGDVKGVVHRVSVTSGRVRTKRYHFGDVTSVCYSPDGKRMATASSDCQTHLIRCDVSESASQAGYLMRPKEKLTGVGYHVGFLDNSTVCTTERDRTVHLWNSQDGATLKSIKLDEGPWNALHIATDPSRNRLVVVRYNWPIRNTTSELLVFDDPLGDSPPSKRFSVPECVATVVPISRSGRYIGIPGPKHTTIVDLELEKMKTIEFDEWVKSCVFTHDEQVIVCAPLSGPVRFYDVMSLEEVRPPVEMDGVSTGCIQFHPSRNIFASTGFDGRIHLYDLDKDKELLAGEASPRYLSTLAFSPDGRRVATGSMDGRVRIFSTATGDELFSVDGEAYYGYVSFSPNGESLAIASGTDRLVLHAPNRDELSELSLSNLDDITCRDVTFYEMNPSTKKK